jgi:hypothetical protein
VRPLAVVEVVRPVCLPLTLLTRLQSAPTPGSKRFFFEKKKQKTFPL